VRSPRSALQWPAAIACCRSCAAAGLAVAAGLASAAVRRLAARSAASLTLLRVALGLLASAVCACVCLCERSVGVYGAGPGADG